MRQKAEASMSIMDSQSVRWGDIIILTAYTISAANYFSITKIETKYR